MEGNNFFRYLTYSEEDEKWQLVCTDVGHTDVKPNTIYPPDKELHPFGFTSVAVGRTLNEYQIIYITGGRGTFIIHDELHHIFPGSVMIVLPGVRHAYKPDFETGWTEHWVGFKGPYADRLRREGFLSEQKPVFEAGLQNSLLGLFSSIREFVQRQEPLFQLKTSACILSLIAEILSLERKTVQYTHSEQLVEKAKFFMEEHIRGAVNLSDISGKLGVSTSHLGEVFKSYTGMTPYQYYISIKIHKAKELLGKGGMSIKEISCELGFEDQYYFSRLFKNKTGISPSQWSNFLYE